MSGRGHVPMRPAAGGRLGLCALCGERAFYDWCAVCRRRVCAPCSVSRAAGKDRDGNDIERTVCCQCACAPGDSA